MVKHCRTIPQIKIWGIIPHNLLWGHIILLIWFFAFSPANASERFFEIKAKKFSYTPNTIKVRQGDTVRIRLISEDVTHGMYVDAYERETSAHPGQDGALAFVADKAGRFSFRCSVTCGEFHPYMIGYLIVEKNFRFWGFAGLILAGGAISLWFIFRKREENV